jgi:hypothetical protein
MRTAVTAAALLYAAAASAAPPAAPLDPAKPADAVQIMKRLQCGEADGKPAVYHWAGRIWARTPGEPDKLLFTGEGMNIRQCVSVNDPQRGLGFRQVSREVMLFLDPKTGEVLRQWQNPWTGDRVDVMHIANDPVNSRPMLPTGADGRPFALPVSRNGDWVQVATEVPLFYENPLGGPYQEFVGNKYHAMEIFDFSAKADELLGPRSATSYPTVSWVRVSEWMPWMKMGSRPGILVFNAVGAKLKRYDELPAVLKTEIAARFPEYTAPPPGDDQRPNATTWTVFKAKVDAERAKAGR